MAVAQARAPAGPDSGPTKLSSGQAAAINSQYSGPGTQAPEAANNYQEVWHYRKELLPKGVSYHQVDVTFITKKGYGVNVLNRDSMTLTTLDAAKRKAELAGEAPGGFSGGAPGGRRRRSCLQKPSRSCSRS